MSKKTEKAPTFEQGEKVKLMRPPAPKGRRVIGHGQPPDGACVTHKGQTVFLAYGRTYQVSENTEAPVANLDNSPLPLINAGWLAGANLAGQFKKLKTESDNN